MKRFVSIPVAVLLLPLCASAQYVETNIAWAKRDLDHDFYPDDTITAYRVVGWVTSPNFSTNQTEIFIQDTNDNVGIQIYSSAFVLDDSQYALGTQVRVTDKVDQSNGLRRISTVIAGRVELLDTNAIAIPPIPLTITGLLAAAEDYEGSFVIISNVSIASGLWPSWKRGGSLTITDTTGSLRLYVDADTDLDGQPAPTNTFDVQGIFSQYDRDTPPTNGYEIIPRYYTDLFQFAPQEPPAIYVENSGTFSVAVGNTLEVNLLGQDRNATDQLAFAMAQAPTNAVLTDHGDRSATFTWTPDSGYAGTTNLVIIEVSDGSATGNVELTIFVLSEEMANIRFNEVLWDPPLGSEGDANQDGYRDADQDEFIEIVNNNTNDVSLAGWQIWFGDSLKYEFTDPSIVLTAKCAVVVFGGGNPPSTGDFGHAIVVVATNGLGLGNDPGTREIKLFASIGLLVASWNYSSFGEPDMSATRWPDFTGEFVLHTSVVDFLRFSPGKSANGSAFPGSGITNTAPLIAPIPDQSVAPGSVLQVDIRTYDPETNAVSLSATNLPPTAVFTDNGDGTALLVYTGRTEHVGSNFAVTVFATDGAETNAEDFAIALPPPEYAGLIINEYLPDPTPGVDANNDGVTDDTDEFVEIVNAGTQEIQLAGCLLYDGSGKRHTFSDLLLPTGASVVVFGGGNISEFYYGPAQLASSGKLGLDNDYDTILLYSPDTALIARVDYNVVFAGASWTRYPDLSDTWANHYTATTNALRASPGRRVTGEPFLADQPPQLTVPEDQFISVSNTLAFEVTAIEPDGDTVFLSASNLPPNAAFYPTSGVNRAAGTFSFTPDSSQTGSNYPVAFYAWDTNGSDSATVIVQVIAAPVGTSVWINELHYDNTGTDVCEFVEVAGSAGLALSDYAIYLYNGSGGTVYSTNSLSGVLDDEGCGYGAVYLDTPGLQNGDPDGLALVRGGTQVIQFLSYDGSFVASDGPAAGLTSTDIGVSEGSSTPTNYSVQLVGTGDTYSAFIWIGPTNASPGTLNAGQVISPCGGEPDSDGDGMPDWWEEQHFGSATGAQAEADSDSDGWSNLDEYLADTQPTNPASFFPRMTNITGRGVWQVEIAPSSTGRVYDLFWKTNLLDTNAWQPLGLELPGSGSNLILSVTNQAPLLFYRTGVRNP